MGKSSSFEVIAGSYEEFLLGYNFSSKVNQLSQSFAAHDHSASVRCVAFSDRYLASGGADDRIFIYDLKSRKQHQTLIHHEATVTCLAFTENHSHLVSGSADGVLAVVRVGNWQVEKLWEKAHKGAAVLDIAVHSSGKLALTLGADCTLCTWNLVKGRQAYIINLRSKCKDANSLEKLSWAPDGVRFVLYGGKFTEIWSIETGGFLKQWGHDEKVTVCVWFKQNELLIGFENGDVALFNIDTGDKEVFKAHDARIKGIDVFKKKIITVSSNGEIKVFNRDFDELAVMDTGCRLTCLRVVPPAEVKVEECVQEVVEETNEVEVRPKVRKAQVIEIVDDEEVEKKVKKKRVEVEVPKKKKKT